MTAAVLAVVLCFGAVLDAMSEGTVTEKAVLSLARRVPQGVEDILMF